MILCDTGPLVALIDRGDPFHIHCSKALRFLPRVPLITTWPCLTEAMHLLDRAGGLRAQEALWSFLADGLVVLDRPDAWEWERIMALAFRYQDASMDLADASLVAAAERLELLKIFTLDRHFYGYRVHNRFALDVIPVLS